MRDRTGACRFWWGELRERDYLEELSVDYLIILTKLNGYAGANAISR